MLQARQRRPLMHEDVDASGTADDTEVTFHGDVVAEANYGRDGPPILLHPRRLPVKTAIAAAALFAIGIVFTLSGVFIFLNYGLYDSLPFFIIGGIGTTTLPMIDVSSESSQDSSPDRIIAGFCTKRTWASKAMTTARSPRMTTKTELDR